MNSDKDKISTIEKALTKIGSLPESGKNANFIEQPNSLNSSNYRPDSSQSKTVDIDLGRLQDKGMVLPHMSYTKIAEEYRSIKRPILVRMSEASDHDRNMNLIMVTSSVPGEGKSFTAINLAMSIAMELDRTVLLVDADITKSDISNLLGIEAEQGLVNVLENSDVPLEDVLLRTNVPKLTVLPGGQYTDNSAELFASSKMEKLLTELAERYSDRVIIFDTPPVLASSEPTIIGNLVGQILFVTEAEKTQKNTITEALSKLNPKKITGLVLNKSNQRIRADRTYGYYSG